MPIAKYNPFTDFEDLPQGMRLFQDTVNRLLSEPGSRPWTPAVDIFETENELVVKADLPDVNMNDIEIKLENGTLSLRGERKFEKNENQKGFHRIERSYGSFVRYFTLPDTVESDKVTAHLDHGVLTITMPKKEVAKPKTIKVQVSNGGDKSAISGNTGDTNKSDTSKKSAGGANPTPATKS